MESVEERISPSVASVASKMAQEWGQVMATVRQDVNNVVSIIKADIAQEEAYFVQQVENLLGVSTTPSSPMSTEGQRASSGTGSGRSATAAHTSQNQQHKSDLARFVADLTGAEIRLVDNPRKEAVTNDLDVSNATLLSLGLQPITLSSGLLREITDIARAYADRCDWNKIPATARWTLQETFTASPDDDRMTNSAPVAVG